MVYGADPGSVGIVPTPAHPTVWGGLMDVTYPSGSATLVSLADGTTSLYTSTGGGRMGGGTHAEVAATTQGFLHALADHLGRLGEVIPDITDPDGPPLPPVGGVAFIALTFGGRRRAEASEEDLERPEHPLHDVFHAAQAVIGALRAIDEA
jgi:hypothetical protein